MSGKRFEIAVKVVMLAFALVTMVLTILYLGGLITGARDPRDFDSRVIMIQTDRPNLQRATREALRP